MASCEKVVSGSWNIQIPKADWLEVVIMYVLFKNLKVEVHICGRATISGFTIREFKTKENLLTNFQKQIIIIIC